METTILNLQERYEQAKTLRPKSRIRDLAAMLDTSEAQLVALGAENILLEGDFKELLKEAHTIGYVMALTRNDDVVHERKGVYNNISFEGPVGLALNPDIDLRLFMMHWQFGFAVQEGERKSLQFFDKSGEAVHKIYLTEQSDDTAYTAVISKYIAAKQNKELTVTPYPAQEGGLPDSAIDKDGFQRDWLELKDTHDFFGLLRKYKLQRTQALRLAPEGYATEVLPITARKVLEAASKIQVPIMVFVGSRGCIQIHTGTVNKLMETGPWFNVLDPEFNLHLRETAIAQSFIVKKPSVDGIVTSLEVFDEKGEMIVQFFGKRKPGNPELETWRELINNIS
jgi:putative hemin transport protein